MSVTIRDVAKKANVAPSTVSRVISDHPKISGKTKKKVRKIMDEMGYYMNYNAQILAQKSTKTIGIVMKNSSRESLHTAFFPEVIRGISAFCSKHDFSISLTTGESEEEIFQDIIKMVRGKRVDGMVVPYSRKDDKVVPYLIESEVPFVVIGKPLVEPSKVMFVDNDNIEAAQEATEYLIKLGHQRIGFIGDDSKFEVANARLNGYSQAMRINNLEIPEGYINNIKFEIEQGKRIITQLFSLEHPPTALMITDDLNALIVLSILNEKQIKVPNDVSVITFNNSINSKVATPPLTSVDIQIYQLGYEAGTSLLELIKEPNMFKKSVIIPVIIEERKSCLPLSKK